MESEPQCKEEPVVEFHQNLASSIVDTSTAINMSEGKTPRANPTADMIMEETSTANVQSQLAANTTYEATRGPEMIPPESHTRQEYAMAMENNPVITAERHAHQAHATTTESSQPNSEPLPIPETSATGWIVPAPETSSSSKITFDEYLALSEITFEWSDSYDDKDWLRLRAILAPTLTVDYTDVNGHKWDAMSAEDFVGIMSHIGFVGDPLVHTQHHIGASKWQKLSADEVIGHHQLRAAHQRYTSLDLKTVENKGHGHAMVKHFYKKINGEWKLAGLRPTVRWNEFEFEKIFKGF